MRAVSLLSLAVVLASGCADDRRLIDSGPPDAGFDAAPLEDAGPLADATIDAAPDAGPPAVDAGPDAGPVACSSAASCGGGVCEDGFCCAAPCGECASCGVAGSEGTCTPQAGGACDDGDASTHTDLCRSDGSCAGTPGCAVPANACGNVAASADVDCADARVIGRDAASGGYSSSASLCTASDDFDDCSWDAGGDHAYRLWMRQGETVTASVRGTATCNSEVRITLKGYQGADCTTVTCGSDLWCERVNNDEQVTHTATRDAWFVIVVDSSTAFDVEGSYQLSVNLTGCADASCGC